MKDFSFEEINQIFKDYGYVNPEEMSGWLATLFDEGNVTYDRKSDDYTIHSSKYYIDESIDLPGLETTIRLMVRFLDALWYDKHIPLNIIVEKDVSENLSWFFLFFILLEDMNIVEDFGPRYISFDKIFVDKILNHPGFNRENKFELEAIKGFRFLYP